MYVHNWCTYICMYARPQDRPNNSSSSSKKWEKVRRVSGLPTPVLNLFGTNLVQDLIRDIWYRFVTESIEQCSKILDSPPHFSVGPFPIFELSRRSCSVLLLTALRQLTKTNFFEMTPINPHTRSTHSRPYHTKTTLQFLPKVLEAKHCHTQTLKN